MLLILAGVALTTLTGQGNIIGNAENAVGKYNNSVESEQQLLNEIEKYFQNYLEGGNGAIPPEPIDIPEVDENGLAIENTTITTDEENVQIVIPKGFAPAILNGSNSTYSLPGQDGSVKEIMPADQWHSITAEQINQGIVIVDNAITYDNGQITGAVPDFNEYVWVSIPNLENDFKRISWNGPYYDASYHSAGTHPLSITSETNKYWDDSDQQEYKNMITSIQYYKGFYIGRYEASKRNENSIAQTKRNILPWTSLNYQTAKGACESEEINITKHLMYGIEWDSVLNWLIGKAEILSSDAAETKTMEIADIEINSNNWGNYNAETSVQKTGTSEYWKANNIYDVAGNAWEWNQEKYSTGNIRANRGGNYNMYGDYFPAAGRSFYGEDYTYYSVRI